MSTLRQLRRIARNERKSALPYKRRKCQLELGLIGASQTSRKTPGRNGLHFAALNRQPCKRVKMARSPCLKYVCHPPLRLSKCGHQIRLNPASVIIAFGAPPVVLTYAESVPENALDRAVLLAHPKRVQTSGVNSISRCRRPDRRIYPSK